MGGLGGGTQGWKGRLSLGTKQFKIIKKKKLRVVLVQPYNFAHKIRTMRIINQSFSFGRSCFLHSR